MDSASLVRLNVALPKEEIQVIQGLSASGVAIYDLDSGQKLFAKGEKVQRPMASLTKLMTALLIAENHQMNEIVTVPQHISDVTGNTAYLPPGSRFRVGDLLSALLINSANDAAITLAEYHSGSVPKFVEEMNARALQLGMTGTAFGNPTGMDHPAHWSTPRDMVWLAAFGLKNIEIAQRMSRSGQTISSLEGDKVQLYHTHALLHQVGPVLAGKTGTTNEAGQCLVSIVEEGAGKYIVVIMHSNQRYKDMETILAALETKHVPVASNSLIE